MKNKKIKKKEEKSLVPMLRPKLAFPNRNFQEWDFKPKKGHDSWQRSNIYVFSMKLTVHL